MNESGITREEVKDAVNVMRAGKVPGLDECAVEYTKEGETVVEWLMR